MKNNFKERYLLIDSIRGVASLWILCFHVLPGYVSDYDFFVSFLKFGRIGTDFFFVTSGFVSAIACNKILINNGSYKAGESFAIKRARKIYRVYLFSLLFAIVIVPTLMSFVSYLHNSQLTFSYVSLSFLEFLQYITLTKVFFSETWSLNKAFVGINGVYWFIAIIIQIYIFIEFALIFKGRFHLIVISAFFLSLLCLIPEIKKLIPIGFFLPKFSEFFLGMILWYLIYKKCSFEFRKVRRYMGAFMLFIFMILIYLHSKEMTGDFYRFISALFITILLFLLYPLDKRISRTRLGRTTSILGKFSYSTYLNHVVFWPFMYMFVSNLVPLPMSLSGPLVLVPLILLCCFIFYALFEYPSYLKDSLRNITKPFNSINKAYRSLTKV